MIASCALKYVGHHQLSKDVAAFKTSPKPFWNIPPAFELWRNRVLAALQKCQVGSAPLAVQRKHLHARGGARNRLMLLQQH